jgi:dihydroorotase-like cyclic amidohydrolase
VVTPQGVVRAEVALAGEKIAAIAAAGTLSSKSAKRVIEATGHIVMPGGIDPHVHLQHSECPTVSKNVTPKIGARRL